MRIFSAGLESYLGKLPDIRGPCDFNIFISYLYTKNVFRELSFLAKRRRMAIMDSGAFTYEAAALAMRKQGIEGPPKNLPHIDDLATRYIKFLKETSGRVLDYFVELDVIRSYGAEKVSEIRERFTKEGLADRCIMVWKITNTQEDLEWLWENCESRYIAFTWWHAAASAGRPIETDRSGLPIVMAKAVRECYRRGVRVHLFAGIHNVILRDHPFYSADSTRVMGTVKFGTALHLDRIQLIETSAKRRNKQVLEAIAEKTEAIGALKRTMTRENQIVSVSNSLDVLNSWENQLTEYWRLRGIDWSKHEREEERSR